MRIAAVDWDTPAVEVLGADLMDGTPIYDVKPYLPYVDSHPEARGGFTDRRQWQRLEVVMPAAMHDAFSEADLATLREVLSLDPRPHYHDDDDRQYGMPFMGCDIRFHVTDGILTVDGFKRLEVSG